MTDRPDSKIDAAGYDPAASGAMGDQSGGGDYSHPAVGEHAEGRAKGGQSHPGYSGPGRLAGAKVGEGADENAVAHGGSDVTPPNG